MPRAVAYMLLASIVLVIAVTVGQYEQHEVASLFDNLNSKVERALNP